MIVTRGRAGLAAWAALVAGLSACAKPTPELQLRMETAETVVPADQGSLCDRMAADYDMIRQDPDASPLAADWGPEYRASFASHLVRAGGLNFVLGVDDGTGEPRCGDTSSGVVCVFEGPAILRVQTVAGDAQYKVAEGERARVATTRASLSCRLAAR